MDVFEVAEILVAHARREHADDVAIVAAYGSRVKGSASVSSDLDLFFIPDGDRAGSLSSQFVLDGRPWDLWPLPWSEAERIANATSHRPWAVSASLIADARVLHHRSVADRERFEALRDRIRRLSEPASRPVMVKRALAEFDVALARLGQIRLAAERGDLAGGRAASWRFACRAVNALALANQTYFSKGWGANLPQVLAMRPRPEGLGAMLETLWLPRTTALALETADRLARAVREILLEAQASVTVSTEADAVFRDSYYFVVEFVDKIASAAEREDGTAAASAAFLLQDELSRMLSRVEGGPHDAGFNLLGEMSGAYERAGLPDLLEPASRGDLTALARRARALDERMRAWLDARSIDLGVLAGEADLRRFLKARTEAFD